VEMQNLEKENYATMEITKMGMLVLLPVNVPTIVIFQALESLTVSMLLYLNKQLQSA